MTLVFDGATNQYIRVEERVDEKGCIDLPRIGKFHVAGMTEEQMLEKIGREYERRHLVRPQRGQARFYTVIGEVNSPGRQLYVGPISLSRAIQSCGGLTRAAGRGKLLLRRENGSVEHYSYARIVDSPGSDPQVWPGDRIEVKRRFGW